MQVFECTIADIFNGKHNFGGDTYRYMLTNVAPNSSLNTQISDISEIAAGNGYLAGGVACSISSSSQTAGSYSLVPAGDAVITAAGGNIADFRYVVLFNDTHADKPVVAWGDYGSTVTLKDKESLTLDMGATLITANFT